jgi:hypothetical protein
MKHLLIGTLLILATLRAPAQGTVMFNNRIAGTLMTRVYIYSNGPVSSPLQIGNGTADTPSGTTDWTGYTALTGSGWMAAIRGGVGVGLSEAQLSFGANPTTATFRSGVNAGGFAGTTAFLNNIPPDTAAATLEVFVWDRASTGITDPLTAYNYYVLSGTASIGAYGLSGTFNVANIGGVVNTPPALLGLQSFQVFPIPEPEVLCLGSLGAAALLVFRRRKR